MPAGNFPIRANLLSNREQSFGVRHRAANSIFGIYQFPDEKTGDEIFASIGECERDQEQVLTQAGHDADKLQYYFSPRLTHVQTNKVRRQIARAVAGGFDLGHAIKKLETIPTERSTVLGLGRLSWMGVGERTLAIRFREDEAYEEVLEVNRVIIEKLGKMGLHGIEPKRGIKPHMSIARFGHPRDGMPLSHITKRELEEAMINKLPAEYVLGEISIEPVGKPGAYDHELDTSEY